MNHYECLKVTADAPTEVIRASYRALAGKRHPDRQGAAGHGDEGHREMVAINAAYEVLVNPVLRAEYDAQLAEAKAARRRAKSTSGRARSGGAPDPASEATGDFSDTRVDIDWQPPRSPRPVPLWPLTGHRRYLAGLLLSAMLIGAAWLTWQVVVRHEMDAALSQQYAARPAAAAAMADEPSAIEPSRAAASTSRDAADSEALARAEARVDQQRTDGNLGAADEPPPARRVAAASSSSSSSPTMASGRASSPAHLPTVTELSRMSDEQLVAVLPALGELQPARGSFSRPVASIHHPLDGKPLNLRSDSQLIDPLAQP